MSQKDARLPVSHKKITGVKKISKGTDASGSTATHSRIAPTVAAVPTRGAWARVLTTRTLNTYTILHPNPRIYDFELTLFGLKYEIANFNLYKIFDKPNCIYEFPNYIRQIINLKWKI